MDKILEALMLSCHPTSVKYILVRRILEAAKEPLNSKQCIAMFELSTKFILLSDTQFQKDVGKEVLEAFALNHSADFENFLNVQFISKLMQDGYGTLSKGSIEILEYIQLGLKYIQDNPSADEVFHALQIELLRLVCEKPGSKLCACISKILIQYPRCIPSGKFQVVFCQQLVRSIGQFQCKSQEEDEIVEFLDEVNKVSGLLQRIWQTQTAAMIPSLQELFAVISSTEVFDGPSNALATVVQYVPLEIMDGVIQNLTNDDCIMDIEMMTALTNMIDWLSWPLANNIDKWIIGLLQGLAAVKKFSILIEVTLSKIEQVFSRLFFPVVRAGALSVLKYMLLSFQHSSEAFHVLVPHIPRLMMSLSKEESNSAMSCRQQLSELVHCMIFRFSGFPDLYEPVIQALKDFPIPNEEKIKQLLNKNAWMSQKNALEPLYSRLAVKSDTGKTGLANLGNTCYMNSVIQALFMASDFRHAVMLLKESDSQLLMMKLQWLFAFLEHSQRPAISPSSFLKASSPPWFNQGAQQDCSEYLRYLLDRLHEEEKASKGISHGQRHSGNEPRIEGRDPEKTLIERMFGGKMVTRILCHCCCNVSFREEAFTDLSLAFPPPNKFLQRCDHSSDPNISMKISSADNLISQAEQQQSPNKQTQTKYKEHPVRVVPVEVFGTHGKAKEETTASRIGSLPQTDFAVASGEKICDSADCRSVSDLINYFLSPEVLSGDNRYYCNKCTSLQEAEKVVELTGNPHYLILTLLRFSFDLATMKRRKILDNVSVPLVLKLPIRINSKDGHKICGKNQQYKIGNWSPFVEDTMYMSIVYDLCSVVVHSGISSESGHYYCYARECVDADPVIGPSEILGAEGRTDGKWYLYNDTRVSFSSFESISNVTSYFPKDTAYVLFYRQRLTGQSCSDGEPITANVGLYSEVRLNKELMEAISRDNIQYLQEEEKEARKRADRITSVNSPSWWRRFDDDENGGSSGNCGPSAGGGNDLGSFGHLIF
ncbi:ubiquitin carboxyl-terminal hydrolase 35-like isoform X1 [Hypanus sabinus]|uniref:ubiquitin carboxyl-terminal hydrolase 35-like isoform X1 n=1 Tax=Hypanus sabinus TaxID=79690 RepID=UPI0028C4703A|nr:ubiquitin carboxyl-terminal hydrolase 35-like isoform X1 [Hypanus sabinus]XP_059820474.1 ubiquitin carboxyl-terminal hydrolase 35-like isoform X1 [Hypanus sabinus]